MGKYNMSKYEDKKILIVGFGLTGIAVAKYMTKMGAKITITDTKKESDLFESISACASLKVEYDLGRPNNKPFPPADFIVVSPGVPLNIKALDDARASRTPITSELELAVAEIREPIIGVTGTNGKTTTTHLIGEMFKADGKTVFLGGNIGKPLLDYVNEGLKTDVIVAELSSFQLELSEGLKPVAAAFTNLEEDHMDRYGDLHAYFQAKRKLLRACTPSSFVVLNYDSPNISKFKDENPGNLLWFMKGDPIKVEGSFAENFKGSYLNTVTKKIVFRGGGNEDVFDLAQFRLFGEHNKENLMGAICIARSMGISPAAIQTVINTFKGVSHRLEFIRKKDGVFFFNDSKGTNVMSVQKSLGSFNANPIILIAGGKDKNSDFTPLVDLVKKKCKILVLLGEAKEKINRSIGDYAETYLVGTFEEAVLLSYQKSRSGDIILLSPGCASYDMFKNYEERGDYFKKLVTQL
jgi:UDP-N-acetylmuramoylalanine--D-glutamate ligase